MTGSDRQGSLPAADWSRASFRATCDQRNTVVRLVGLSPCALALFNSMKTDDGWRLGACLVLLPDLDSVALVAWQSSTDIVMTDPTTCAAALAGDGGGWIVCVVDPLTDCANLFINGLSVPWPWAASRVAWLDLDRLANVPGPSMREPPDYALPALSLAGSIPTVRNWAALVDRSRVIVDDPRVVQSFEVALLRAKCLLIVEAVAPRLRKVARYGR